jgi:dihydrofolate synthase / folylpolyglutamate synthase
MPHTKSGAKSDAKSGATSGAQPASAAVLARLKTLHPKLIDLSLGRIAELLQKLGHPERRMPPVVHIAGTNGKGSTTAYLRAMFEASGRRVHAYTSPHLVRFHERISVPGADGISRAINEAQLLDILDRVETANAGAPMTFFEITTAAAFVAFADIPADVVLLEVGLGGEFDATNVIDKTALSVITPIAFDHMDKLGRTLPEIASAKAGILKRATPAIIAPQQDDAMDVIERRAATLGAPLTVWGRDFDAYTEGGRLLVQTEDELIDLPRPSLIGPHQVINAGTAVMAARAKGRARCRHPSSRALLATRAHWPARMQPIKAGPLRNLLGQNDELWLDGGHNPAGGMVLAETLAALDRASPRPTTMILGMMGQKDAAGFLEPFRGLIVDIRIVPVPGTQEAPADPKQLAEKARALGFHVDLDADVPSALRAIGSTPPAHRVLICGSLYLAGHVLALNEGLEGVLG